MKLTKVKRIFSATKKIKIKDCGSLSLQNNEQISLKFKSEKNDITKKNWGFYLTNSCNKTLKKKFRTAICIGKKHKKIFVMLVHKSKITEFKKYLKEEKMSVQKWLDK